MSSPFSERLDRRTAIKWMATAAASATLMPRLSAQTPSPMEPDVTVVGAYEGPGYGTDPDLLKNYAPGDLWPLTFDDHQRHTAAVLCGLIIPADSLSGSAADLKVHDFIDEWISSPYPGQSGDRKLIITGLAELDRTAVAEFGDKFAYLDGRDQATLCDRLARVIPGGDDDGEDTEVNANAKADPGVAAAARDLKQAQRFFRRYRELTAGGFFTTPEGLKDIGYRGNTPLAAFPKPPEDLLLRLGLK